MQRLFGVLVRHFLERLWNNELASASGDAKLRMVQAACAAGLPGFVMALYLYPVYHPPRGHRAYWSQVGDHWFYVVYSFVAMGLMTLFAWDFFFPDHLDVYALGSLPVRGGLLFRARIAAIAVFLGAALFDANFLASLVLPEATDPPHLGRFLLAHLLSVAISGAFAALLVLAMQGLLLAMLGGRMYARLALAMQAVLGTGLFTLLLTAPAVSDALKGVLTERVMWAGWMPPMWFLGLYQRLMEGNGAAPVYGQLAVRGCVGTVLVMVVAAAVYPLAYRRRVRELAEGSGVRSARRRGGSLQVVQLLPRPVARGIWGFVSQTLARVPRYRTYLAMYGGLGLALLAGCAVRFAVKADGVQVLLSPEGLRAAVIVASFWVAAGLRALFLAPGDRRPGWAFRVLGRPQWAMLEPARQWALTATMAASMAVAAAALLGDVGLRSLAGIVSQAVMAVGLSLLLADSFWFGMRTLPFQNSAAPPPTRIAWVIALYMGLLPALVAASLAIEDWMGTGWARIVTVAVAFAFVHTVMRRLDRRRFDAWMREPEIDEDAEAFPQRLGLRY
ncbi:hypothetical protein [Silvibacterium dinghuense]|uniref:Uncharacterized protein n=1 Tax=Silvibacterium dinghuense TaxID=1560006 RepID=A0A4Q1SHH8_9BACT|nr:hypothetical protein [Silvibacterium dinghuense]RXS96630.1 hypothetical protein ESZ00_01390 [Silvibacterium dinghuense]